MQLAKDLLRRALVAPLMLIGWLIVLVIRAMWGRELFWHEGVLVVQLDPASWPLNAEKKGGGWYRGWAGTCFGHGIMLSHSADARALKHEMRHSEQHDANAVGGLIVALPIFPFEWWAAVLVWVGAPLGTNFDGIDFDQFGPGIYNAGGNGHVTAYDILYIRVWALPQTFSPG